jgi:hypothetical protein
LGFHISVAFIYISFVAMNIKHFSMYLLTIFTSFENCSIYLPIN